MILTALEEFEKRCAEELERKPLASAERTADYRRRLDAFWALFKPLLEWERDAKANGYICPFLLEGALVLDDPQYTHLVGRPESERGE